MPTTRTAPVFPIDAASLRFVVSMLPESYRDLACAECFPHAKMPEAGAHPGFQCFRHKAEAWLKTHRED